MKKEEIQKAWQHLRRNDSTIPDDVLDFMRDCAIEKLSKQDDKDINVRTNQQTIKLAEEYFEGHQIKRPDFEGALLTNDSYNYHYEEIIRFTTDFAEFYHEKRMNELFESGTAQNELGINCVRSESYISLIFDRNGKFLSDLTKTE